MDLLVFTLVCIFGLLCGFNLKSYIANAYDKAALDSASDSLIDGYLDIIDNVDDLDEAVLLRDNLVLRMRQNKAQRGLLSVDPLSKVVNFSDYRIKKNNKILKKL